MKRIIPQSRPGSNRQTRITVMLTLTIAVLLLLLGAWSSLIPHQSQTLADNIPSQAEENPLYQSTTVPITYYINMPIVRLDPTPTPTPTPPFLFYDDFSNPYPNWPVGQAGDCEYEMDTNNGVYRIIITEDRQECVALAFPVNDAGPFQNGVFSTRVRRTTPDSRKVLYGFYFAAGSDYEEDRWGIEVNPHDDCDNDGFYWLYAIEDKDQKYLDAKCTGDIDTDEDDWNTIEIYRFGAAIDVYINGKHKKAYNEDYNLSRGYFDLVAKHYDVDSSDISGSHPIIVEFDYFRVDPYRTPPRP